MSLKVKIAKIIQLIIIYIYNQLIVSANIYATPPHNSDKRELIWKVIEHYLNQLERDNIESVFTRRHKFLRALKWGENRDLFTQIFVDEFQNCTQADYQIFYGLLKDNNQLVVAGDFAQAVHLGKSASIPRVDEMFQGAHRMENLDTKKLE